DALPISTTHTTTSSRRFAAASGWRSEPRGPGTAARAPGPTRGGRAARHRDDRASPGGERAHGGRAPAGGDPRGQHPEGPRPARREGVRAVTDTTNRAEFELLGAKYTIRPEATPAYVRQWVAYTGGRARGGG